ncbi:MAG: ComF family protein [Pseudomonadota bacterium]
MLRAREWLWTRKCLLCLARAPGGKDLCAACDQSLPRLQAGCPRCGAPGAATGTDAVCGECQRHPPAYDATRAVFRYAAPVDRLIQHLKYHGRLELSRVLGGYLARHLLASNEPLPDVLLPVPLHVSRLRQRGYNQSLEIARFVGGELRIPLDRQSAQRVRATTPQMELPRDQRRRNVHGAFEINGAFNGKRVAIVDDVMTSGHTVNALAECLRKSGAKEVRVWVVARA